MSFKNDKKWSCIADFTTEIYLRFGHYKLPEGSVVFLRILAVAIVADFWIKRICTLVLSIWRCPLCFFEIVPWASIAIGVTRIYLRVLICDIWLPHGHFWAIIEGAASP